MSIMDQNQKVFMELEWHFCAKASKILMTTSQRRVSTDNKPTREEEDLFLCSSHLISNSSKTKSSQIVIGDSANIQNALSEKLDLNNIKSVIGIVLTKQTTISEVPFLQNIDIITPTRFTQFLIRTSCPSTSANWIQIPEERRVKGWVRHLKLTRFRY